MHNDYRSHGSDGATLPEMLAVLLILVLGASLALPSLARLRSESRVAAGARHMAAAFNEVRWQSVAKRRYRGLYFQRDEKGWSWRIVQDGNGNGLRTAEVRRGVDRVLSGPYRLEHTHEGVRLGFLEDRPVPRIPPRRGFIEDREDPVRFGRSDIVSFSPIGSSSSGTLYVTDGAAHQFGVVLFGPSTRVRVWRYDRDANRWSL